MNTKNTINETREDYKKINKEINGLTAVIVLFKKYKKYGVRFYNNPVFGTIESLGIDGDCVLVEAL